MDLTSAVLLVIAALLNFATEMVKLRRLRKHG